MSKREKLLKNLPPTPRTNIVQILGGDTLPDARRIKKQSDSKKEQQGAPAVKQAGPSPCLSKLDQYKRAKIKMMTTKKNAEKALTSPK